MKESWEDLIQKIQKQEGRGPGFVSCLSQRPPVQGGGPVLRVSWFERQVFIKEGRSLP